MNSEYAVLLSIHPRHCAKIAAKEKTFELRKQIPNLPVPFKCYIYCTKQQCRSDAFNIPITREELLRDISVNGMKCLSKYGNGTVWAEFICDRIEDYKPFDYDKVAEAACIIPEVILRYASGRTIHGLHISSLYIYSKPRELTEFCVGATGIPMMRPPQSWCYVKEISA